MSFYTCFDWFKKVICQCTESKNKRRSQDVVCRCHRVICVNCDDALTNLIKFARENLLTNDIKVFLDMQIQ
jgi:hypothetical protein